MEKDPVLSLIAAVFETTGQVMGVIEQTKKANQRQARLAPIVVAPQPWEIQRDADNARMAAIVLADAPRAEIERAARQQAENDIYEIQLAAHRQAQAKARQIEAWQTARRNAAWKRARAQFFAGPVWEVLSPVLVGLAAALPLAIGTIWLFTRTI